MEATISAEHLQEELALCEVGRMAHLRLTEHLASKSKSRACTVFAQHQRAYEEYVPGVMTGKGSLAGVLWSQSFTCLDTVSRYGQSLPCLFCELSLEGAYSGRSSSSSASSSSTFALLLEASEGCPFAVPFCSSSTERFMNRLPIDIGI